MSATPQGEELLKQKSDLDIRTDGYKLVSNKSGENTEGSVAIRTGSFPEKAS